MFCALATTAVIAASKPAPPPAKPSLAVVFHVGPPASADPALAAADVALRAPEEIGEPVRALRGHAHAHIAFAIDPSYLSALARAAAGDSALAGAANGGEATASSELLAILARHRPLDPSVERSHTGSRYLTLATSAATASHNARVSGFSAQDVADFAGTDAAVVLAETGALPAATSLSDGDAVRALAQADGALLDELKSDVRSGAVEVIATPDGDPVLPLLIDAGGKATTDTRIVDVGASADAAWLSADAVRAAAAFGRPPGGLGIGFYSPFGAYDDATGPVVKSAGAAYALFSDRVVSGSGGGAPESDVDAATSASLRAYALTIDRGVTLPVLFWSEEGSATVQSAIGASTAMAQELVGVAGQAASLAHGTSVLVLRIDSEGPWAQRSDARAVVDRLVETIASGAAGPATTPAQYLRAHPATASAYGYPAAAEYGSLGFWMGTPDQASLWKALAAARTAAGGDAAIRNAAIRPLLVSAESGSWYSALSEPVGDMAASDLDAFRALIANIYRAAGARPPAVIAPVKATVAGNTPTPVTVPKAAEGNATAATPAPSPTP